jgi:hypothetical protein
MSFDRGLSIVDRRREFMTRNSVITRKKVSVEEPATRMELANARRRLRAADRRLDAALIAAATATLNSKAVREKVLGLLSELKVHLINAGALGESK